MALKDKTVPKDASLADRVARAIEAVLINGKLPCSAAFTIAKDLAVTPQAVGAAADLMSVHLTRCQLGFFGRVANQGHTEAGVTVLDGAEGLTEAVQAAQTSAGNVSCSELWVLAASYAVPRILVGDITNQLGVHVTPCQLGAF